MDDNNEASQDQRPVRSKNRRNKLNPTLPTRRSSRLSKLSTAVEEEPAVKEMSRHRIRNMMPLVREGATKRPVFFGPNPGILKRRRATATSQVSQPPVQTPDGQTSGATPPTGIPQAPVQTPDNQAIAAQPPSQAPNNPTGVAPPPNEALLNHSTEAVQPPNEALLNHPTEAAQAPHEAPAPDMSPTEAAQVNDEAPDNQTAQPPNQAPSSAEEPNPTVSQSLPPTEVSVETEDATYHSLPSSPTSYSADSLLQTEAGESGWSDWEQPAASTEREEEPSNDESNSENSMHTQVKEDDGAKRCLIRRRLRDMDEAKEASGRELDDVNVNVEKTTRKRKKGQNNNGKRGRGMAKPRKIAAPECRPVLIPVGDAEFDSLPNCSKVATTVRILTLENLPGPYRTYNMFPAKARLEILKQFLQRYSWREGEDVGRCLDVFERIASEAFSNAMSDVRGAYTKKYGKDKEVWKDFIPQWCKNEVYWKGLCLIWSKEKWDHLSNTNRKNKLRKGKFINHVAGRRSIFRHKQALASEKGSAVGLKEVFDRTHMKATEAGKVYVNERAQSVATDFVDLKKIYGTFMSDAELWELAAEGEDQRGRVFGFGHRSRTSKANQALQAEYANMSDPAKSTATSAEDEREIYTKGEVAVLIKSKIAAERRKFTTDMAAQEKRHREEFEELKKTAEYNKACLAVLLEKSGVTVPPCNDLNGAATRVREEPQKSNAND